MTVFEDIIGLFGLGDDSDSTDEEVGDGFLDVLGERYLWLVS